MKKSMMNLAAGRSVLTIVLCCAMTMAVLTACSDITDNPAPKPEQESQAEYTIMYYTAGARNIDVNMLNTLSNFYDANPEAYKKVNVVVQYKYSTAENLNKTLGSFGPEFCTTFGSKTLRWAVDPAKKIDAEAFDPANIYGADNADITCPDSLTNFINWAARKYPAKKYMLVVADHGGGYVPGSELPETGTTRTNRSIMNDDGYDGKAFTAKSLSRGIKNANVRLQTIYMLACMMNNMEYQFELKDLCDYVIASTYVMPANGGAMNVLVEQLSQPSLDIEHALDEYIKADVKSWEPKDGNPESTITYNDLTLTRTANIDKLGTMMRQFVDRLCETYTNGTEAQKQAIDSCTAGAVKVQENYPSYDVAKYMSSIISALPEVYDISFFNQMGEAFNSCIAAQYYSAYLTAHHYMVDYSVLLGANGAYNTITWNTNQETGVMTPTLGVMFTEEGEKFQFDFVPTDDPQSYMMDNITPLGNWGGTFANTYEQLAFDKTVGWSRWLRLNKQWPNLFCPSGFHYELPSPDADSQN
jgi:hypothetical protein